MRTEGFVVEEQKTNFINVTVRAGLPPERSNREVFVLLSFSVTVLLRGRKHANSVALSCCIGGNPTGTKSATTSP
ncbi:hypothetical protein ATANTOWER_019264 [Ataeniobius toweri]|uniref:Uncharacterized protein n=1 Tax=Ataeniobius toweri TaxID=208326 RepID=A0ABU7C3P6_9TELE|nr:hypothetical protein [Ataeniobius toweri]